MPSIVNRELLEKYLEINVKVPKKGEKLRLVEMAIINAKISLNEKFELIKKMKNELLRLMMN